VFALLSGFALRCSEPGGFADFDLPHARHRDHASGCAASRV